MSLAATRCALANLRRRRCTVLTAVALAGALPLAGAQAPQPLTAAQQQQIDAILHKMTLQEKVNQICDAY